MEEMWREREREGRWCVCAVVLVEEEVEKVDEIEGSWVGVGVGG